MRQAAFISVAAAAALGLAALAIAQESTDEQFMPVGGDPNWYLQRSGCTLARSENGESREVIRLRIAMGVSLEVIGERPRVRNGDNSPIVVMVDGASEDSFGIGFAWEDGRSGYLISVSDELLNRLSGGRRLEISAGGRRLRAVDLAGAGRAIAAMRACYEAEAAMSDNMAMSDDMMAMDMNFTNAMDDHGAEEGDNMSVPNAMR